MPNLNWLAYSLAFLMVAISMYCLAKCIQAVKSRRTMDYVVFIVNTLIGVAMVGILIPRWHLIPKFLWVVIFASALAWFAGSAIRLKVRQRSGTPGANPGSDRFVPNLITDLLVQALKCAAMIYMYALGMPVSGSSTSLDGAAGPPAGLGDPALTLLLICLLVGASVWQLDALSHFSSQPALPGISLEGMGPGPGSSGTTLVRPVERLHLAPRIDVACNITMCLTMGFMLILLV